MTNLKGIEPDWENKLGSGSYGSVFKGTIWQNKTRKNVAIKRIENDGKGNHFAENAHKEHDTLKAVGTHRNIIELIDFRFDTNFIYIIMEYGQLGDLENCLQRGNPNPVFKQKIRLMSDCAKGVSYMHSLQPQIVHRDIKPGNIIMHGNLEDPVAKIADFGLARLFNPEGDSPFMSTDVGTLMYRAPEQFGRGRKQYTAAIDIFSMGLVYLVILEYGGDNRSIEPLPASLRSSDLLPYAQYLMEAIRHKTPMPAMFTLTCRDKWPVVNLKGLIASMTAYNFKDCVMIHDVLNMLNVVENMNSATSEQQQIIFGDMNGTLQKKDQEIADLKLQVSDLGAVLQENDTVRILQVKNDTLKLKDEIIDSQKKTIQCRERSLQVKEKIIQQQDGTIETQVETIKAQDGTIKAQDGTIKAKDETIQCQVGTIESKNDRIQTQKETIQLKNDVIETKNRTIEVYKAKK